MFIFLPRKVDSCLGTKLPFITFQLGEEHTWPRSCSIYLLSSKSAGIRYCSSPLTTTVLCVKTSWSSLTDTNESLAATYCCLFLNYTQPRQTHHTHTALFFTGVSCWYNGQHCLSKLFTKRSRYLFAQFTSILNWWFSLRTYDDDDIILWCHRSQKLLIVVVQLYSLHDYQFWC